MCPAGQFRVNFFKPNVFTWPRLLLLCMIFHLCSYSDLVSFYITFLIIGSHIVFISILCLLSRSLLPTICSDSLRRLILQCSALSIISTSSFFLPYMIRHTWNVGEIINSPKTLNDENQASSKKFRQLIKSISLRNYTSV